MAGPLGIQVTRRYLQEPLSTPDLSLDGVLRRSRPTPSRRRSAGPRLTSRTALLMRVPRSMTSRAVDGSPATAPRRSTNCLGVR